MFVVLAETSVDRLLLIDSSLVRAHPQATTGKMGKASAARGRESCGHIVPLAALRRVEQEDQAHGGRTQPAGRHHADGGTWDKARVVELLTVHPVPATWRPAAVTMRAVPDLIAMRGGTS